MSATAAVAEHCRQTLIALDQVSELPGLSAFDSVALHLHRMEVQDTLHGLGVSE